MLARWSVRFAIVLMVLSFGLGWFVASVHRSMPNFDAIHNFQKRQQVFVAFLLPLGRNANRAVLWQRHKLQRLYGFWQRHHQLADAKQSWVKALARSYGMSTFDGSHKSNWVQLLVRVDVVPLSMMLAQAANESAWGTSRFAQQANNLFGRWCFSAGCGLVPARRPKGASYEVKVFPTAYASVQDYVRNLNTNRAYAAFRQIRAKMRQKKLPLTGEALAVGLGQYSQKGQRYVGIIRSIIVKYHLAQYDVSS